MQQDAEILAYVGIGIDSTDAAMQNQWLKYCFNRPQERKKL